MASNALEHDVPTLKDPTLLRMQCHVDGAWVDAAGKATIRYEFSYDGGGPGKGGDGKIFVNGEKVAEGRIERTQFGIFSADEGVDVGQNGETNVTDDYKKQDNKFTGKIHKVTIEVGPVELETAETSGLRKAEPARKAMD